MHGFTNSQAEILKKKPNSSRYRQTKRKYDKLSAKLKKDQGNLNKFNRRRHKSNVISVNRAISRQYSSYMAPKACLYETSGDNNKIVFIFATSENESNESTITGYPVDHDEEVADHSLNGDKTVTIEGLIMGNTLSNKVSATNLYNTVLNWRYKGTELTYRSNGANNQHMAHIYNKHFRIQSLSKIQDQPYVDAIKVSITLKFVYVAQVSFTKRKINHKGKKVAKGSCTAPKVITCKKGITMHDYAKKYHTTVRNLLVMNSKRKYTAHTNLAGKKLQVTGNASKNRTKKRLHHAKTKVRR